MMYAFASISGYVTAKQTELKKLEIDIIDLIIC